MKFIPELGTLLSQFVVVGILFWFLKKYALPPLLQAMRARSEKISADLKSSQASKAAAEELVRSRQQELQAAQREAQEIIKEGRLRTETETTAVLLKTEEQAARIIADARTNILKERTDVSNQLKQEVATLVYKVTAKVLEKELGVKDQERLVAQYVEQVAGLKR
ncbi:MAG: synthase subunit [Bacillota bacterium]|jgi:F-type H+-transporting ATPase subunit b